MHSKGVALNRLSPHSILHVVAGPQTAVKLTEFDHIGVEKGTHDIEKILGVNKRDAACYVAPEVINAKWSIKVDEWAVGVMAYYMLTGNPPFFSENYKETLKQITNYKFDTQSERWLALSQEARDVVLKLMAFRPEDRTSAESALRHPWFKLASRGDLDQKDLNDALGSLKGFHTGSRLKQAIHSFFV